MKKLMMAAAIVCAATAAQAAKTYGITVDSKVQAYSKDTEPGTEHGSWYSLYVMKYADAQAAMGVETYVDYLAMATWLGKDFAANKASIIENSQSIGSGTYKYDNYGGNLYQFSLVGSDSESSLSYAIGVYFYDDGKNVAYNVMQNSDKDTFYFHYNSSPQSGWTEVTSVPEPTSGLLMLIGMAGLALKRKRV